MLAVSLHPMFCRIHLLDARPQRDRTEPVRGFVRTASATLAGLPLIDIEQVADDRAVVLRLEGWSLAIELTGRHANAFLLDRGGIIRSSYRASASRKRSLLWGSPYLPPIPRPGAAWAGAPSRFAVAGIHEAIAAAYAGLAQNAARAARRAEALRGIRARAARLERLVRHLRSELVEAAEAEAWRRRGELLKPVAARLRAGAASARAIDYFDPATPEVEIPLDPALDGPANLRRCFSMARRLARRPAAITPRLAAAEADLAALRAREAAGVVVEEGGADSHLPAVEPALRARARPGPRLPYRAFRSSDGHEILVGRSAADNDVLTFRIARGDDAWIHAAGAAGSHVVIRLPRGREPTEAAVSDAATLALHYSGFGRTGEGEVLVTRRKHIRRVRGAKPGRVVVAQERRMYVRIEPERLRMLLDPRR